MFEGAYNPVYSNSIADFGAKRILGTNSIMNYINTGKTCNGIAYRGYAAKDRFSSTKPKNRFDKLITFLTLSATIGASLIYLNKKGKINADFLKSIGNKFKPTLPKISLKNPFASLKTKISKVTQNKTSDGAKVIYGDICDFTSRAAKKAADAVKAKEFFEQIRNKI